MTRSEQMIVLDDLHLSLKELLTSKSNDYADAGDVLGNFKRLSTAATALNIDLSTPAGYALFMVLLKIDRINNLTSSSRNPENESLTDSYKDGIAYMKLAYCCYIEANSGS